MSEASLLRKLDSRCRTENLVQILISEKGHEASHSLGPFQGSAVSVARRLVSLSPFR